MINVVIVVCGGVGKVAASALRPLIVEQASFTHLSVPGQAQAAAAFGWLSTNGYEVLTVARQPLPAPQRDVPSPREQM